MISWPVFIWKTSINGLHRCKVLVHNLVRQHDICIRLDNWSAIRTANATISIDFEIKKPVTSWWSLHTRHLVFTFINRCQQHGKSFGCEYFETDKNIDYYRSIFCWPNSVATPPECKIREEKGHIQGWLIFLL